MSSKVFFSPVDFKNSSPHPEVLIQSPQAEHSPEVPGFVGVLTGSHWLYLNIDDLPQFMITLIGKNDDRSVDLEASWPYHPEPQHRRDCQIPDFLGGNEGS